MTKTNDKDISNEQLAEMIAKGFENTATKQDLAILGSKADGIDERLTGVEDRLTIVETKLDKVLYWEFERVDKLEKDMKIVKQKLRIAQ